MPFAEQSNFLRAAERERPLLNWFSPQPMGILREHRACPACTAINTLQALLAQKPKSTPSCSEPLLSFYFLCSSFLSQNSWKSSVHSLSPLTTHTLEPLLLPLSLQLAPECSPSGYWPPLSCPVQWLFSSVSPPQASVTLHSLTLLNL